MHSTFKEFAGVSRKIKTLVQYFSFSFIVKLELDAHSIWDSTILSKSVKTLLIKEATSHIEVLFSKTKIIADIDEMMM